MSSSAFLPLPPPPPRAVAVVIDWKTFFESEEHLDFNLNAGALVKRTFETYEHFAAFAGKYDQLGMLFAVASPAGGGRTVGMVHHLKAGGHGFDGVWEEDTLLFAVTGRWGTPTVMLEADESEALFEEREVANKAHPPLGNLYEAARVGDGKGFLSWPVGETAGAEPPKESDGAEQSKGNKKNKARKDESEQTEPKAPAPKPKSKSFKHFPFVLLPPNMVAAILGNEDDGMDCERMCRGTMAVRLVAAAKKFDNEHEDGNQINEVLPTILGFLWAVGGEQSKELSWRATNSRGARNYQARLERERPGAIVGSPGGSNLGRSPGIATDTTTITAAMAMAHDAVKLATQSAKSMAKDEEEKKSYKLGPDALLALARGTMTEDDQSEPQELSPGAKAILQASTATQAQGVVARQLGKEKGVIGAATLAGVNAIRSLGPFWANPEFPLGYATMCLLPRVQADPTGAQSMRLLATDMRTSHGAPMTEEDVNFVTKQQLTVVKTTEDFGALLKTDHAMTKMLFGEESIIAKETEKWVTHFEDNRAEYESARKAEPYALAGLVYCRDKQRQSWLRSIASKEEWSPDDCSSLKSSWEYIKWSIAMGTAAHAFKLPQSLIPEHKDNKRKSDQAGNSSERPGRNGPGGPSRLVNSEPVDAWKLPQGHPFARAFPQELTRAEGFPKLASDEGTGKRPICLLFYVRTVCTRTNCSLAHKLPSAMTSDEKAKLNSFFADRYSS
jgi:hypothetical protein